MSKIEIISPAKFKFRSDTKANWQENNPVLLSGEIGIEVESGSAAKVKIGDGENNWNNLPYYGDISEELANNLNASKQYTDDEISAIQSAINSEISARQGADEALESQIPTKTSDLTNDSGFITNTVDNLTNYYLKSETYTQEEVQALIAQIQNAHFEVVQELPQTGESNVIYLVPRTTTELGNIYDEYVYVTASGISTWEKIGSTDVDLTGYVKNTDYAAIGEAGVIKQKASWQSGLMTDNNGCIQLVPPTVAVIKQGTDAHAITVSTAYAGVFYGLAKAAGDTTQSASANAVGNYTEEAKAAIQSMLGIPKQVYLTQAEYDALTAEEKADTTKIYNIYEAIV